MKMKYHNFLITGGMGFIGSNFIQYLLNKNVKCVVNIDNLSEGSNIKNLLDYEHDERYFFYQKSILDKDLNEIFQKHNIDVIVHFAAQSHVDRSISNPRNFLDVNILGTYNLLNIAKNQSKNIHFHHVSTDEVFGSLLDEQEAFTELNQFQPNSPYSASKAASDHLVRAWHHTYNMSVTTSNCSNNYGPHQHTEKLIPVIISSALREKKIPIYGDGQNIRDWLYVEDHCEAIFKILHKGVIGDTYNIGGNNEIKNIDIVHEVCNLLDDLSPTSLPSPLTKHNFKIVKYSDLIAFVKDRPGHDYRYAINSKKIKNELNWEPKETFSSGIEKTVSWYIKNIDWLNYLGK